jgi:solute carrier family 25 S-adenosylmethionine transporter 26
MYSSFTETIRGTYKEGGNRLGSFYKGFGITIMREIPFSLIQFPLYEFMKVRRGVSLIGLFGLLVVL